MSRSFRLLALLGMAALAGCGTMRSEDSASPAQRLYSTAYRDITETYIDPISPEALAMAGLKRLSRLDASLSIERRGADVTLLRDGVTLDQSAAPTTQDAGGWGTVTARLVDRAKALSPDVAAKPDDQIDEVVLNGALTTLDRYSRYARPDAAREEIAERDGFGGIGIGLDARGADIRISSVMAESPAGKAGLRRDDRLLSIDGKPIREIPQSELPLRLRGASGTAVSLTILRPPAPEPFTVSLTRAFLVLPTVTMSHDQHHAVFHISSFNHLTARSLTDELRQARQEMGPDFRGIILDLRNNRGGLLDQAVDVASLFLGNGTVISVTGRHPGSIQRYEATPRGLADGIPMAVLVNGGSASSSEVVAAALQDTGRAVVIGSSSYGKGTVQTVLNLPNGGELVITSARLVTPAGYALNEHGVVPTVCTSELNDQPAAVGIALRRAIAAMGGGLAGQPRASLDEPGWIELRRQCPTQRAERSVDLRIASRVLGDLGLYRQTLGPGGAAIATAP